MPSPPLTRRVSAWAALCGAVLFAAGCHEAPAPEAASAPQRPTLLQASYPGAAALGAKLYFDSSLSASGRQSCASCHDPAHAYTTPDGGRIQRGGANLDQPGLRAVPSLRYTLRRVPVWSKEYQRDETERLLELDSVPVGGLGWDGRFDTLRTQAAFPLLALNEMGNADATAFAARLARVPYIDELRQVFGADALATPERALATVGLALERYEIENPEFAPYSSRYDDFLDGKLALSEQEQRGLALFVAPDKGNCAACHTATRGANGAHPLFTDFSFQVLGVPRNPAIAANADPAFHDLGLCGPLRSDQRARRYCGMFKTPSLRNVATRRAFFHNARFDKLRDAVGFYATRDSDPARWYPQRDGVVQRYDDLPQELRGNVDHVDAPFSPSARPRAALSDADIDDLVAFLGTLTDRDVAAAIPPPAR
ncbi:cytochrome-c peroxidase [Solimonas terrae]|uniref:C-type cytochrome n=1 Tax=Solimonas terrae TaxID=1396819 RepID=A0A6M2BW28_9GAMM|nr:cytochrome c peroxidase [Solimonas terrae]NGY06343.1 c-type cytochrome [Solimonas terrae]